MKKIILSAAMLTGVVAMAQNTGIGTTNPQAKLEVKGNTLLTENTHMGKWHHVLDFKNTATPTNGYKIITNLPYENGYQMPLIKIQGYAYGIGKVIDIDLVYYVFNGSFINYSAANNGGYAPNISLSNENGKVVIFMDSPGYYYRFNIQAFENMLTKFQDFEGWTVADEALAGTNTVAVTYSQTLPGNVYMPTLAPASGQNMVSVGSDGLLASSPISSLIANNSEWAFDSATNQIRLKRSGTAPFKNQVYYDAATGKFVNTDISSYFQHNYLTGAFTTKSFLDEAKSRNNTGIDFSNLEVATDLENVNTRTGEINDGYITAANVVPRNYKTTSNLIINPDVATPTERAYSFTSGVTKMDNNATAVMIGAMGHSNIVGNGSVPGYMTGTYSSINMSYGSGAVNLAQSQQNRVIVGQNAGHIVNVMATSTNDISLLENSSSKIKNAYNVSAKLIVAETANPVIDQFSGFHFEGLSPKAQSVIAGNAFGLRIGAMGAADNRYSVYTETGKVSFGDRLQLRTINDAANASSDTSDKILVADAQGNVKTQTASAVASSAEPWRVTGTSTAATQNTQNIYQTGAVAIGTNPAAQENNKLYIENKVTDAAAAGRTSAIYGVVESNTAGSKNAINLQVTDRSTTGSGTLTGSVIAATDSSTSIHTSYGSSSSLTVTAAKNNPDQFNVGDYNLVQLMPSGGNYSTSFVYGNMAIATMPSSSTGDVTTETLRAYSGYAYPQPGGGRTFTAQNLYGAHIAARPRPAGGTVNLGDLYAVSAQADLQGTSGSVNITGRSVALRATSYLSENSIKNIGSLYGVQIEGGQTGGSATIGNAYGLYINRFRFDGAAAAKSFNLYSEGADTKNYFQGQVGIGTDAPTEKLEVAGNVKVSSLSSAAAASTATTDRIVVADTNGVLKVKDASGAASITNWFYHPVQQAIIANNTTGDGGMVTVSNKGSIAIGDAARDTPRTDAFLDINMPNTTSPAIYVTGSTDAGGRLFLGDNDDPKRLVLDSGYQTSESPGLFAPGNTLQLMGLFSGTNQSSPALEFGYADSDTNPTYVKAMTLTNRGNFGIGTQTPSERLEVAGTVKANKFIAGTATFPDYVFQNYYTGTASSLNPAYKFTSLKETEKFIKDNGHLPGFRKAEEIVKEGSFDVSGTALKSLEKIEELYLHIIEQQKTIEALQKRIDILEKK